jgi:nucleoside-diphosphate-sugar epimerase
MLLAAVFAVLATAAALMRRISILGEYLEPGITFACKEMKVGIIGSKGYIGSFLTSKIAQDVVALDTRESGPIDFSPFDVILYLGGISKRSLCDYLSKEDLYRENVEAPLILCRQLRADQLFLYTSTSAILEGSGSTPVSEEWGSSTGLDAYSESMQIREKEIAANAPCRTIGLRIGMCCGISSRQRYDLGFMKLFLDGLKKGAIEITNTNCWRPILSLDDLAHAIQAILKIYPQKQHTIYNLCSFNISMGDLGLLISERLSCKVELQNGPETGFSMDCSKLMIDTGFKPESTGSSILEDFLENKKLFERFTNRCRVCTKDSLELVLDLGNQPLVNNYLSASEYDYERYPLTVYRCPNCSHTQLGETVAPEKLFRSYTYKSGVGYTATDHFNQLAGWLLSLNATTSSILELACNDGSQLDCFQKRGVETFGVDPAENIVCEAAAKGHQVICGFWGDSSVSFNRTFDLILAQNVFAHVPDPNLFLEHCILHMNESTLLYIQTSQSQMFLRGEFDTIYHEHMSFFTLKSFRYLADFHGLTICNYQRWPVHGTSYGLVFKKRGTESHCAEFEQAYLSEEALGLYSSSFYFNYRMQIHQYKRDFLRTWASISGKKVAYGAAAKGLILLNFIGVEGIEYIVDDSPLKKGLFTPGIRYSIVDSDILKEESEPLTILVLPWNLENEIVEKIRTLRSHFQTTVVIPLPAIRILHINPDSSS